MKHLIIDADSLAYRIPHANRVMLTEPIEEIEVEDDGLGEFSEVGWAKAAIQKELDYFLKLTKCETYELHMTANTRLAHVFRNKYGRDPEPCFRYAIADDLSKGYKSNRKAEPLVGYEEVYTSLVEDFDAHVHDVWEADDMVVALKRFGSDDDMLCALDKDVLNQTEGAHYNYGKIEQHITSHKEALFYKYWQAIVGDPGDGYGGVPGVGPAKAKNLINVEMSEKELWNAVVKAYKSKGLGETEALATVRLADMRQLQPSTECEGLWEIILFDPEKL